MSEAGLVWVDAGTTPWDAGGILVYYLSSEARATHDEAGATQTLHRAHNTVLSTEMD